MTLGAFIFWFVIFCFAAILLGCVLDDPFFVFVLLWEVSTCWVDD